MMDKFRTLVDIPGSPDKISYHSKCLFMGSCFADNIGECMAAYKFPVLLNPFGTLFNPSSMAENLNILIQGKEFSAGELVCHDGLWFSFNHYTAFAHPHLAICLSAINKSLSDASSWLKQCSYLLLTFGTAWIYIYNKTGKLVANCHKIPAVEFTRKLLEPRDIIESYDTLLNELSNFCPGIRIIFTVSPVRHWKDGAVNNQLSKSILHYSIQELLKLHKNTTYFPAYEIFMDELRDYRFYANDMLHPSDQGTSYVWERFIETWMDESTKKPMAGVKAILKAVTHRPLHTETLNHKKFIHNTLKQIEQLTGLYPFLDFSKEIDMLRLHST
jgi:hypothetical protein